jgi:formylglycine-generating enzyme required for sulfatase activity
MLTCALMVNAQSISVSCFRLLENDLDANTAGTMEKDQNGEVAALIKVVTTQTGFTFDGGALGIVKTKQTPGEIWVYIPRGSKKISIKHQQLGVLRDYYFPISVEAARTYEMVLVTGTVETTIHQARTSQYVVFQLTPSNAFVELDGEVLQTNGGTATKMMKFGTYNYRVQAPNYLPEAGNVTVNDPNNKHIVTVALKPNFSTVTLNVDGDAEIWVNGERKGTGSWTGNLGAGTYEFETRKPNHRSISVTHDITVTSEPQTISLQSPTPILGEVDINSAPAMADIYIDGKKVGQTPQLIGKLLIGQHQVRISRQGYRDFSSTITVKEGETSTLSATLEDLQTQQAAANTTPTSTSSDEGRMTFTVGKASFTMILVDGGTFSMGATSEQGEDAYEDESPAHQVTLSSFYIGETEVSQALWDAVMDKNYSTNRNPSNPVTMVSWQDCQVFVNKLNQRTGQKFRLPTEAEWEFAARGGNKSQGYKYSGSNNVAEVAWCGNNKGDSHSIKSKKANELGLYDMSGNVWEWVQDKWGDYPSSAQTNPTGASSGYSRVFRGGSYFHFEEYCRVSKRYYDAPDSRYAYLGFRLALQ